MQIGNRKPGVLLYAFMIPALALSYCTSQSPIVDSTEYSLVPEYMVSLDTIDWNHGAANCNNLIDEPDYEEWQQVQYHPQSYVFRQNKCSNYEAPFVYFFIGDESALLVDSGATVSGGVMLREKVREITALPLLLAHTHGHGDHRLGDEAFQNQKHTSVVEVGPDEVISHFGFSNWPLESVTVDLGGREIEILPIPGHSDDDLAFYDGQSQVIVTGDSLYPGRLYVRDWVEYRKSIDRLADWLQSKPVSAVLGTHIEMSSTANIDYPIGTTFQPNEHKLPLAKSDIYILRDQVLKLNEIEKVFLGSYIIWPI